MSPPRAREVPGPLPLSVTFIYAPAGLIENPQCGGRHASVEKLQQRSLEKLPPGHPDPRNPKEGQGGGSCVEKGSGGREWVVGGAETLKLPQAGTSPDQIGSGGQTDIRPSCEAGLTTGAGLGGLQPQVCSQGCLLNLVSTW